ncbi:PDZ domain [Cinara cedri]|uniref:PDZ domain n=1 Tax=Cinara cedri TaxID=506608 RepID=A0A5E4MWS3_9HEMI|nr:PDZ domain [Cinara cedri]
MSKMIEMESHQSNLPKGPRTLTLTSDDSGFGFTFRRKYRRCSGKINGFFFPNDIPKVTSVIEGGAAHRGGLRAGDRILKIGDILYNKFEVHEIQELIDSCVAGNKTLELKIITPLAFQRAFYQNMSFFKKVEMNVFSLGLLYF